uniref:Uncharacterized protein n=1 Tax=Anguilla anguilla TaxID=7936 RepID=A0A0E9TUQ6_ANGAN
MTVSWDKKHMKSTIVACANSSHEILRNMYLLL